MQIHVRACHPPYEDEQRAALRSLQPVPLDVEEIPKGLLVVDHRGQAIAGLVQCAYLRVIPHVRARVGISRAGTTDDRPQRPGRTPPLCGGPRGVLTRGSQRAPPSCKPIATVATVGLTQPPDSK